MNLSATSTGVLYIIATPIGHRDDISLRALQILESVDFILAEDTRHSAPLLASWGIKKPLVAFHAHNEGQQSELLVKRLKAGEQCALISDAGTPLISDPGFPLVRLARESGIQVVPIPGACALVTALSAAGVPCEVFTFGGFLPSKESARRQTLEAFSKLEHTLVFYESTHRILDCLEDVEHVFGETCQLVLAKELTKMFESFVTGTSQEVGAWLQEDKGRIKGEFVVIIPARAKTRSSVDAEHCLSVLLTEVSLKKAVKLTSLITGTHKNLLYPLALKQQREEGGHENLF